MMVLQRIGCLAPIFMLGCSGQVVLGPADFTEECRKALIATNSQLKVSRVSDLELCIECPETGKFLSHLETAYEKYKGKPSDKTEVIDRFVQNSRDNLKKKRVKLEKDQIIPVIRGPVAWSMASAQFPPGGPGALVDNHAIKEPFINDLFIHYVQENDKSLRLLGEQDLIEAKIDKADLRMIACDNLKGKLPRIESTRHECYYTITADGDHESSLLLFNPLWDGHQFEVKGNLLVALPTRDILLVTGTEEPEGIEKLRTLTEQHFRTGTFPITQRLFVRVDGGFVEWVNPKK